MNVKKILLTISFLIIFSLIAVGLYSWVGIWSLLLYFLLLLPILWFDIKYASFVDLTDSINGSFYTILHILLGYILFPEIGFGALILILSYLVTCEFYFFKTFDCSDMYDR